MYFKFFRDSNFILPVLGTLFVLLALISACGIFFAPSDYLQGLYAKIMYIHVPSAWLALGIFIAIAIFSFLYLIFKNPMYDLIARSLAPIGLIYNFTALFTGALWGKPTWGTYWVWDARLTSMFIQFCIYIIYTMLRNLSGNEYRASYVSAIFAVFAAINIPIIKFSVYIWNTLHQKSSIITVSGPKIHFSMLWPLLCTFAAFMVLTIALILMQFRLYVKKRFRKS